MAEKWIGKVTVTGADDSVAPEDLLATAREFPFVEFGLLLSRSTRGTPRFPSDGWIKQLVQACRTDSRRRGATEAPFAGHFCGSFVRDILCGAWPWEELQKGFGRMISRWQLNTYGVPHACRPAAFISALKEVNRKGRQVTLQYDWRNPDPLSAAVESGCGISVIYDASAGCFGLPGNGGCPQNAALPYGIAGEFTAENLERSLAWLASLTDARPFWLHTRTAFRAEGARFDLGKVHRFLTAVRPWVMAPDESTRETLAAPPPRSTKSKKSQPPA